MRTLTGVTLGLCCSLLICSGCNRGEPGGPGAVADNTTTTNDTMDTTDTTVDTTDDDSTRSVNKPLIGEADNTFTLSVPTFSTTLAQGETKNVTIGISRGDNFDADVTLEMTNLPNGVKVDPQSPVIKKGTEDTNVSVSAADDAALGDFTIKVNGVPAAGGATATNDFQITVEKKE